MATSNPDSSTNPSSVEEAEQRIRHICRDGCANGEIQPAVDLYLLPHVDQILVLPKTTYFTDKHPLRWVISWALVHKCYALLRYLLHNGWELEKEYFEMEMCPSFLGYRTVLRDIDLTRFLLTHGADPGIGKTPQHAPIRPTKGSKGSLLYLASIHSSLETFKLLQSHGANLTYAHALHGAASTGPSQIPIIRHLLDSGAVDVDELDVYHVPHQGTPLQAAIQQKHVEVVRVLMEYGAHPLARIESPYELSAEEAARNWAPVDEAASKEILGMLEEAKRVREREGRLGNVPVTGRRRPTFWGPGMPAPSDASVTSGIPTTSGASVSSGVIVASEASGTSGTAGTTDTTDTSGTTGTTGMS